MRKAEGGLVRLRLGDSRGTSVSGKWFQKEAKAFLGGASRLGAEVQVSNEPDC